MTNLMPRDFFTFPRATIQSLLDEDDDLMSLTQAQTGISVSEDDDHIHIDVAMPGVDPDNIEMTFDRGMLWIRGEAREEEKDKQRKFYRRAARSFSYRIAVPGEIDQSVEPKATCENGILYIEFPKSAQTKPRKLKISLNGNGQSKRSKESKSKSH